MTLKRKLLREERLCPWWLTYSFDHRFRRLLHNPQQILQPYLSEGDKAADIGCGMGFFAMAMELCEHAGFQESARPVVHLSRAVLFNKAERE